KSAFTSSAAPRARRKASPPPRTAPAARASNMVSSTWMPARFSAQSVTTAANRAGIQVLDTIFEALAAAECTIKSDERELGVCLLEIGAGTTELISFFEGCVAHTGVVPLGG